MNLHIKEYKSSDLLRKESGKIMVYKCPNCGGALEYSVTKNKMVCDHCEDEFDVNEINKSASDFKSKKNSFDGNKDCFADKSFAQFIDTNCSEDDFVKMRPDFTEESMTMTIVRCTSCGAELAANENEVATFCAYCGQPTVVFDRIETVLKPEYIIPFEIEKKDAERIIRDALHDGLYIPKKIKKFQTDKLRGIYVPFWNMNFSYEDEQTWKYVIKYRYDDIKSGDSVTRYVYIHAKCDFHDVLVDASSNLNDDYSQRLEPYDMRQRIPFNPAYLSGFYADKFDKTAEQVKNAAYNKLKSVFNDQMHYETGYPNSELQSSNPKCKMTDKHYALYPAWFLSFKYKNKPYTILVNGQTGKMVGAVPFSKFGMIATFILISSLFSLVFVPVSSNLATSLWELISEVSNFFVIFFAIYIIAFVASFAVISGFAIKIYTEFKKKISITSSEESNRYMNERQEK